MFVQACLRLLLCIALLASLPLQAEEEHWYDYDHLYLQGGSYVHFESSDDHAGNNIFVSLEAVKANDWLYGLALFDNSFNQFSQYLYVGKSWHFDGRWDGFHAKITAGLIHGYKDEFEDKIPFNDLGVAPGLIPGVGYKKGRFGVDMILLGNSAMLFTVGMDL